MSGLIAVRQSGPIGARKVETILLSQGAAFDLSGDIALNSAFVGAGGYNAAPDKAVPVGADLISIEDSTSLFSKAKLTFTNLLTFIFNRVSTFITGTGGLVDKGLVGAGTISFNASAGSSQKATITANVTLESVGWAVNREQAINLWITITGGPLTMSIPGSWNDKDGLFAGMATGLHLIQLVTIDTGVTVEVLGGAR